MIRTLSLSLMALLAFAIGLYALGMALVPTLRGEFVLELMAKSPPGATFHFLLGGIVLIAGACQFSRRLRGNYLNVHRWLGRVYVSGVLISGLAGLYLAFSATGGVVARFGFGLLALTWLTSTGLAFANILAGHVLQHQQWMTRSYALCLAAVTLRLYIPLFAINGVSFDQAYPAIAWLCWVPNLLVAEWLVLPRVRSGGRQEIRQGVALGGTAQGAQGAARAQL